jgi:hypothetical protein
VNTSVGKSRLRYLRWLVILLSPLLLIVSVILAMILWHEALLPKATIHYSANGKVELRSIWNVQHRIYKGKFPPGASTSDYGFLFPDEKFFMEFYWWDNKTVTGCVSITPRWSTTHIYLDEDGNVDTREGSGTDIDYIKPCPGKTWMSKTF